MSRLGGWWFQPAPSTRLAMLRIGLALFLLVDLLRSRGGWMRTAASDPGLFDPVGLARLGEGPLSPAAFQLLFSACFVGVLAMLAGIGWRVVGPLLALGWMVLVTYRLSWGQIYRSYHLPALHLLVLAFSPAATSLSVDGWLARRRPALRWLAPSAGVGSAFGWPIRLMCAVTTITYLLAGIAKLRLAGFAWAEGQNLLDQIGYDALHKALLSPHGPSALVPWLYQHPWLLLPVALGSLVLELGAPLVLLHPRAGQLWSVAAMGMHWGIRAIMTITFPYPVSGVAFLSFFPVERLLPRSLRVQVGGRGSTG